MIKRLLPWLVGGVLAGGLFFAACGAPKKCDISVCPNGCCDAAGNCKLGSLSNECGSRGGACSACAVNMVCQLGVCTLTSSGGGGGGGSGGGSGGGTGGGSGGGVGGGSGGGVGGGSGGGVGGGSGGGVGGGSGGGVGGGSGGGVGGGSGGGVGGGSGGGGGSSCPTCNTLTLVGAPVAGQFVASGAPPPSGGTLVPGTYVLSAVNEFTGTGGQTGPNGQTYQETVSISASTLQSAAASASAQCPIDRVAMSYSVSGSQLTYTGTCPSAFSGSTSFSTANVGGQDVILTYDQSPAGNTVVTTYIK